MEIEAKFSFRDAAAFDAWQRRESLGPYTLGPLRTKEIVDRYLDTDRCACLAGGYACRIRQHGADLLVTLKSLADADAGGGSSVRRRDELEVTLPAGAMAEGSDEAAGFLPPRQQPSAWPESDARVLALRLTNDRPLYHLVTVQQRRQERDVIDRAGGGERVVAVQSLDRVSFPAGGEPMLELELELSVDGTDADMAAIVAALRDRSEFLPVHGSKLGQALSGATPASSRLALAQNRIVLAQFSDERDRHCARSALGLLAAIADTGRVDEIRTLLLHSLTALAEGRSVSQRNPAGGAADLLAGRPGPIDPQRAALAAVLEMLASFKDGNDGDRTLAACIETLPRHPEFAMLDRAGLDAARTVATIIRVALALDTSQTQSTRIAATTGTERRTVLTLTGAYAVDDGDAAAAASHLWAESFGVKLRYHALAKNQQPSAIGLRYNQDLASAGRLMLRQQYDRFVGCQQSLQDEDAEALHDARVAVRRLRTALRLLQHAFVGRETGPLLDGLKRTGDRLGAVRDLDVLLARVRRERESLPDRAGLDPLLQTWERRRGEARERLLRHLDSNACRAWSERLAAFLDAGGTGRMGSERVCDVLPQFVWKRYGVVRAYQPHLSTATAVELHDLRKDAKHLRYLLEFFRELLNKQTGAVIEQVIAVQDALGDLHDAYVLSDLLGEAMGTAASTRGLEQYHLRVLAAIPRHRRAFDELWPALAGREFREALARAVASI